MVYVGIDVAKDKHDCFIVNSDGEVLFDVFNIQNNIEGFEDLLFKIKSAEKNPGNVKVGLEATGHYSCNILGFLKNKGSINHRNQSAVHQSKPEKHQSA